MTKKYQITAQEKGHIVVLAEFDTANEVNTYLQARYDSGQDCSTIRVVVSNKYSGCSCFVYKPTAYQDL